jgi:hypothetical protein
MRCTWFGIRQYTQTSTFHLINILTLHTVALWNTVQTLGMRGTLQFLWQTFTVNRLDLSRLRKFRDKPVQLRLII